MALLTPPATSPGGLAISHAKDQTRDLPTCDLLPPETLYLPLLQGRETPTQPCVETGDRIRQGQLLAKAIAPDAIAVHAPADAVIADLTQVDTAQAQNVPAIELRITAPPSTDFVELPEPDPKPIDGQQLHRAAAQAGILLSEPLPASGDGPLRWLIVNALESELVQTVMHRTLIELGSAVLTAARRLGGTLDARRVCLVIDRKMPNPPPALRRQAKTHAVRIVRLSAHYPASATPLVVQSVIGRQIPIGRRAIDIGAWVIDPQTLLHLDQAAYGNTPQTWQTVTVSGDAIRHPGCYRIPLGTTLAHIAEQVDLTVPDARIIVGDLLSGRRIESPDVASTVLTKQDRSLIFLRPHSGAQRLPQACIRCGLCLDHCPVDLDPRAILDLIERRQPQRLARQHPGACIDCGLCDFICPSSLPLMRAVQRGRGYVDHV